MREMIGSRKGDVLSDPLLSLAVVALVVSADLVARGDGPLPVQFYTSGLKSSLLLYTQIYPPPPPSFPSSG